MFQNFLISLFVTFLFTPLFWTLISKISLSLSILSEKIAISLSK